MKALLIADEDDRTELSGTLRGMVCDLLRQLGAETEIFGVNAKNLTFCKGCYGCWVKTPGECVMGDSANELNRKTAGSEIVVYLGPVRFGQFGTNIKNAIERGLPNLIPYLVTRSNGASSHPYRYEKSPLRIYIGYGEQVTEEERANLTDMIEMHRDNAFALVYTGEADKKQLAERLDTALQSRRQVL